MLGPATAGQLRGDVTQQGREIRTKARCPLSLRVAGLHEAPIPLVSYPSPQLLAGGGRFLLFGQAQRQKDRGKLEEGGCTSEEHPCLSHSLPKVHAKQAVSGEPSATTCTKFPSDNSAGETFLLTLETSALGLSGYVNPTT